MNDDLKTLEKRPLQFSFMLSVLNLATECQHSHFSNSVSRFKSLKSLVLLILVQIAKKKKISLNCKLVN